MPAPTNKTMKASEWLMLIVLSILWGGSFFLSKVAVAELRPFTLVLGRVAVAAVALNGIVIATGQQMPTSLKAWGPFLVMGLINNLIPFSLIFWGQTQIASGLASVLNATSPLWTVVLAHFLTRDERMTPNKLAGVLFGLLGVVVVIGPDVLGGLGLNVLAQFAVIGAALSYAFAGIYGKRFKDRSPYVAAAGQVTATTLMMLPIALWVDRPWLSPVPGAATWGAVLAIGLLSTAVAYGIYFRLLAIAGATNVLLVTLLVPISALLLGALILGERIAPRQWLGMGLVAMGLVTMDGRLLPLVKQKAHRLL